MRLFSWIKKNLFCRLFHSKHMCFPEVWIENPKEWHCKKCYPCTGWLDEYEDID